jgi:hypothetical protein
VDLIGCLQQDDTAISVQTPRYRFSDSHTHLLTSCSTDHIHHSPLRLDNNNASNMATQAVQVNELEAVVECNVNKLCSLFNHRLSGEHEDNDSNSDNPTNGAGGDVNDDDEGDIGEDSSVGIDSE